MLIASSSSYWPSCGCQNEVQLNLMKQSIFTDTHLLSLIQTGCFNGTLLKSVEGRHCLMLKVHSDYRCSFIKWRFYFYTIFFLFNTFFKCLTSTTLFEVITHSRVEPRRITPGYSWSPNFVTYCIRTSSYSTWFWTLCPNKVELLPVKAHQLGHANSTKGG